MSRTQTNLGDPWKNNKSSAESEKSLILHGCNSTWILICCKGLKQLWTSSISNLLFSNKQNVRWHQVNLKWDFSSPALIASHLPSLPWRTCGADQLRWSLEGHRLRYSLCRWKVCTHTVTSVFRRKDDFFTWKIFMSAPTTTWGGEVAMCCGEARNKTTAVFWSNILVTETLHNWVLSFLGQRRDFQSLYFSWQMRGISSSVTSRKFISCTQIWSASAPASRAG